MAVVYVDSAATGAADGTTWNDAFTSLLTAITDAGTTAGSTIYVDDGHSESPSSTWSMTNSGTPANPIYIISVDKTTATALDNNANGADADYSAGASVTQTAGSQINIQCRGRVIVHGLTLTAGDLFFPAYSDNAAWEFHDCTIGVNGASGRNIVFDGVGVPSCSCLFVNCTLSFAAADQGIWLIDKGYVRFVDCVMGGTAINALIEANSTHSFCEFDSCDFSGMASGGDLVTALPANASEGGFIAKFSNCKLPTSGSVLNATFAEPFSRVEAYNVATDNTIHRFWVEDYYGKAIEDTAVYRTATYDGTNGYSAKLTTSAQALEVYEPFHFQLCEFWAAANPTITVELIHEVAGGLDNDEFWIEVRYPDSTTGALGKVATTRPNPQATPTGLTNSTESWTENLTSEVKEKVSHTVSGGQAGVHQVWVYLAKPSTTVYVDPHVDIS